MWYTCRGVKQDQVEEQFSTVITGKTKQVKSAILENILKCNSVQAKTSKSLS